MRVLFINSRPDAEENPGGDNIQMLKTKSALEDHGVDVMVIHQNDVEQVRNYDLAHVFNIQTPVEALHIFHTLEKKNIPVVLSPIYWDMYEYWGEMAVVGRHRWHVLSQRLGKSKALDMYITWQRMKAPAKREWKIQRQLLRKAHLVLPNSVSEGDLLRRSFWLGKDFTTKVRAIPNGVDLSLYATLPDPSVAFFNLYGLRDFVLQVGTINPVKNQLGLIQALFDLHVPLVFIGKVLDAYDSYGEACRYLGEKRGNVFFIDRVPHHELPGTFALAAVHALPSWRETPGLVSLEAGAAGCRVVTTSIGSTREYFGDLAWYCYPSDSESICIAVENAYRTKHNLGLRERILKEYTWDRAGATTLAAYKSIL